MQVGDVEPQRAGGGGPAAAISRQRAGDRFALERLRRLAQAHRFRRRLRADGRQGWRFPGQLKMLRLQHDIITRLRRPRQHHRPMNRVLQFAYVARP